MNFFVWGIYDLFRDGLIRRILLSAGDNKTTEAIVVGCGFLFCIVAAYLLGSINWALVISKTLYHEDIRTHGSGNAGTTNILRTYGKRAAILTFLGDTLKGVLAVLIACVLFGHPADTLGDLGGYLNLVNAAYLSALFCILGHIFPCFSHFKGGKGFATLAGVLLVLDPAIFLILFIIYVPLILVSHYVSLSSIIMAMFYPVLLAAFDRAFTGFGTHVLAGLMMGALITWSHRSNIKRLLDGTERKIYLFRKKEAPTSAPTDKADKE